MKLVMLLIMLSFGAKQTNNVAESDENNVANVHDGEKKPILVKIEEDECAKVNQISRPNIFAKLKREILRKKKRPHNTSE